MKRTPWFSTQPSGRLALAALAGNGQTRPVEFNVLRADEEPKRTVRAGRRRPSGPSTEPRERADAPHRERPDQPAPSAGGGKKRKKKNYKIEIKKK